MVWAVAFSPDGNGSPRPAADPSVKLWDWQSGEEFRTIRCHGGQVHDVAFSPDGTRLATASHDLTIKFWDLADDSRGAHPSRPSGPVNGVAFHPDGRILASAGAGRDHQALGRRDRADDRTLAEATTRPSSAWRSAPAARPSPRGTRKGS